MMNYKNSSCSRHILKGCRPKRHIKFALVTGKDVITNSDGKGSTQIDGVTLGYGVANGKGWAFDLGGGVDLTVKYAGEAENSAPLAMKRAARWQCAHEYNSTIHYKKRSLLSIKLLGCRPKWHVKSALRGVLSV